MAMKWNELSDASGDGRGRPSTVGPTLEAIPSGGEHVFGPFTTKGSAASSMTSYSKRAEAHGVTFDGPATDGVDFYIRASRA